MFKNFGNPVEGFKQTIKGPEALIKESEELIAADTAYDAAFEAGDEAGVLASLETLERIGPKGYAAELRGRWENHLN